METVLLCWHVKSVAGASRLPSIPAPFGTSDVPSGSPALSSRAQALTESASPACGDRAPAKQKKQRESPQGEYTSLSEVLLPRERLTRLIFPGWLPFGGIWQWDFVKPAVRAWENPTGRLHSNRASRGNPRSEGPHPCFSVDLSRIASPRLC